MLKVLKTTVDKGMTTITYDAGDDMFQIESRRTLTPYFERVSRRPRFMRPRTRYIVTMRGKDFQEFDSLKAAAQFIRG
jgi:hypothetical protein